MEMPVRDLAPVKVEFHSGAALVNLEVEAVPPPAPVTPPV